MANLHITYTGNGSMYLCGTLLNADSRVHCVPDEIAMNITRNFPQAVKLGVWEYRKDKHGDPRWHEVSAEVSQEPTKEAGVEVDDIVTEDLPPAVLSATCNAAEVQEKPPRKRRQKQDK